MIRSRVVGTLLVVALYDLPVEDLRRHVTSTRAPQDLDAFWADRIGRARSRAEPVTVAPVDTGLVRVRTDDVWFGGDEGHRIAAWYHRPTGVEGPLPVVVRYQGYGMGRGLAHQVPLWVSAGYACLEVDTRGQGSVYGPGDTPDPAGSGPAHPGFLTRGLDSPEHLYFTRVFTDAVLAVDAVVHLPQADADRVVVCGGSQGGGITIAVAALHERILGAMPDVPFLCDIWRGAQICDTNPYAELRQYLSVHRTASDQAFATLAYVDAAVLASRARVPALFSVAFMDPVCPPSTVYAAYQAWIGPKRIVEYPWNGHEGGQAFQEREQLRWLADLLAT